MSRRRALPHALGPRTILCAALALGAAGVEASWQVDTEAVPETPVAVPVARVDNESGHSLRIYEDAGNRVHALFTIRGGFDTLDPAACPTIRVDRRRPERLTYEGERCLLEPKRAQFTLGKVGEPVERTLRQFLNGSRIVFRYRLAGGAYRETGFTLHRSKHALYTAIPTLAAELGETQ